MCYRLKVERPLTGGLLKEARPPRHRRFEDLVAKHQESVTWACGRILVGYAPVRRFSWSVEVSFVRPPDCHACSQPEEPQQSTRHKQRPTRGSTAVYEAQTAEQASTVVVPRSLSTLQRLSCCFRHAATDSASCGPQNPGSAQRPSDFTRYAGSLGGTHAPSARPTMTSRRRSHSFQLLTTFGISCAVFPFSLQRCVSVEFKS